MDPLPPCSGIVHHQVASPEVQREIIGMAFRFYPAQMTEKGFQVGRGEGIDLEQVVDLNSPALEKRPGGQYLSALPAGGGRSLSFAPAAGLRETSRAP